MRWVVGLLLVFSAVLKAFQLIAEPTLFLANSFARFLMPLQIAAELGFGVFALAGLYWRQLRWLALLLFTGFALYSLYLAISDAATCGCFGPIEVNPWWTFVLDVAIVTGLMMSIFAGSADATPPVAPRRRLAWATTLVALSVGGAIVLIWHATPSQIDSPSAVGNLVLLEPEDWIGKPLPIADFIGLDLSSGNWIVLLHRHDCPECQEAAPHYEHLAISENVALIEMPPYSGELMGNGPALHARLADDREWFVQTPVEIRLDDGVVVSVSTELPALAMAKEL